MFTIHVAFDHSNILYSKSYEGPNAAMHDYVWVMSSDRRGADVIHEVWEDDYKTVTITIDPIVPRDALVSPFDSFIRSDQ